ncbi:MULTISPECIES: Clp protease N-terminal domain-containing protein [Streptomyces]|uniref:Putative ATP-dependent Clp protease ATP-binding subunit n=1 Tax=Streptomyces chartreusis NRRL 3882 TaxID=1079985 RepID=A0A2N9B704_STRCX|nr:MULTISPECIES: Clp protease N-terminal domain-containing protein [Streptomyces]MYS94869.1 peptidase [Streptomyces sp. SID5464]SOR79140.1 putative ATP-dependent Clp protease ATP-binding subunit [Streptomyces chartreusis NRRL 3882]
MFERFTKDARSVVKGALASVEGGGGGQVVEPEHLLLALLDREGSRGSFALAALGLPERRESVRQALGEARRRAGLSQAETDALAGLGIDVEEIVARVEEVHGVGAMAGDRKDKGWWFGRASFGRGAKDVLERSLRVALAQRDRHIGDEHILLALTVRPGVPAEVLADHGVTYESVVRVLYGSGGEAKAG